MAQQRLSRRELLHGILLALGLAGCGGVNPHLPLLVVLKHSLPGSLIREFRRQTAVPFQMQVVEERAQLLAQLQDYAQPQKRGRWFSAPPPGVAVSMLGADGLDRAIASGWLDPWPEALLGKRWADLHPRWQQAVQRQGRVWGVPWRWGVTAIAYRQDRVGQPIRDWADLWRPELAGKITLPDHPREVIGLTLKKLGRSYNDPLDPEDRQLRRELGSLHAQVLAYTSSDYLPMLRIADSWVAVGWSQDLYRTQASYPELKVVIPASGSAVWWDMWVYPHRPEPAFAEQVAEEWGSLVGEWIDFLFDPEIMPRWVQFGGLPSVVPVDPARLPSRLHQRQDFQPQTWQQAEIWQPLSPSAAAAYLELWQQMRQGLL